MLLNWFFSDTENNINITVGETLSYVRELIVEGVGGDPSKAIS